MTTTTSHARLGRVALRLTMVALVAGAAVAGGCRGDRSGKPPRQFFPGLDDQPKMKARRATPSGTSSRVRRRRNRTGAVPPGCLLRTPSPSVASRTPVR
ncbi:MAG: hypothetical protein ACFHWZ_18520 [Phycisphaerales bacterium]